MTKSEGKTASAAVEDILRSNPDGLHDVIRAVMQEVLGAEMDEALAAPAPQAPEVHQHAGASERGDQAPNLYRANLPQCRELPAYGPGPRRRNQRKLDGGQPLHQHGRPQRAQKARTPKSRMTSFMAAQFAELDAYNLCGTLNLANREPRGLSTSIAYRARKREHERACAD